MNGSRNRCNGKCHGDELFPLRGSRRALPFSDGSGGGEMTEAMGHGVNQRA